ncbi:MAG: hypothetical protein IH973_11880, partial [Myxococcales bacterium]|nr:hypothetical protein [Myxococcales bacterium]
MGTRATKGPARSKRKKAARKHGGAKKRSDSGYSVGWVVVRVLTVLAFIFGLSTANWIVSMNRIVVDRFDGQRFAVPSKVYSAPGILYPGLDAELIDLRGTLARLGYREQTVTAGRPLRPGLYRWSKNRLRVYLRAFSHPTRPEPARDIVIRF